MLAFVSGLTADAPPALTTIRWTGTDFEGRAGYTLEWDAAANTLYRLQTRGGFESNTTWETFDLAVPSGAKGLFKLTPEKVEAGSENIKRFFQVLAPQPEIFGVQPLVVSASGDFIYIIGQCFPTNALVYIGDVLQTNTTWLGPGMLQVQVTFNPPPSGQIAPPQNVRVTARELGGNERTLAQFDGGVSLGSGSPVSQRLLEVPDEPPASPAFANSLLMPALMKAKEKANRTKCGNNLRTIPGTGELQLEETDLVVPGRGLDFVWTRTYRSRSGTNTAMGQGWSHGYDIQAFVNNGGVVIVLDGSGRRDSYFLQTNSLYTADELFNEGSLSNGVFTLTFPDRGKWEFNSLSNAIAPGKISHCVDRNGNALTFNYDTSSRLTEIIDTLGRTNLVAYDGLGRLFSVTDFSGRACTYTYWRNGESGGSNGDLRSVTTPPVIGTPNTNDFPLGKTTTYTYSKGFADNRLNHNLLTITDGAGQTWFQATYADTFDPNDVNFDRLVACARGVNPPSRFTYTPQTPAASNGWAVIKTICNDPVGNVTIDLCDSLNRGVIHRDLAARAVPGAVITENNLPSTKLRDSDPDFWETRFEWNADSLCTRIVYPHGNSTECVYQRAFNQNSSRSNNTRRHDGDLRVLREVACCAAGDLDGDGLPDRITSYFQHDPRFGSGPIPLDAIVPTTTRHAINTKGTGYTGRMTGGGFNSGPRQTTSIDSAKIITDRDSGRSKGFGFVISSTDPRGNVETSAYDSQGNCTRLEHHGYLLDGSDHPVTSYEYNSHGQLTAIVNPADANGYTRRDELSYYDTGAQNGYCKDFTVDAQGPTVRITSYDYDAVGNMTQLVDPRGNTNRWIYNALNQVVKKKELDVDCAGCIGNERVFFYDANDNLVRTEFDDRDFTGAANTNKATWTTLYDYDELNRCRLTAHELTHTVQQGGGAAYRYATNRFVYDANNNVIESHSPEALNGNQPANYVQFEYDTRQLPFRKTRAPGTADTSGDQFDYDANGNCVRETRGISGGLGAVVWQRTFDGFDRCVTATDPMGNVSTSAYDGNGNLVYARHDGQTNDVLGSAGNQRLAETRYEYDSLNRRARTHVSFFDIFTELPLFDGESTTTLSFAPNGACRSVTDDNGHTTRYGYDTSGRLSSTSDPKTNTVNYVYDANDNVVAVIQNDSSDLTPGKQTFTMRYEYDALDRCVVDYDNVGNTNRYGYDSRGYLVNSTDPRGNQTTYGVIGLGLRAKSDCCQAGAGYTNLRTTHTEYDDNGRPISFSDGNSNVTRYVYDALNRQIATTNADGTVESLVWSPRSNVILRTDPNGTHITYTYDDLDRCTRKDIVPGAGVASTTTFEQFTYDGAGHLMLATNDTSMVEFGYNSLEAKEHAKADCIAARMIHDGVGNRLSLTYSSGRVLNYSYNALDEVNSLDTSAGGGLKPVTLATFSYEGPGRPGRMTRGTNTVNTRLTWNGLPNPANAKDDFGWQQISMINHQVAGGGAVIDRRLASYDRNQNKTLRQQTTPFATGVPALTTNIMAYDALNRMSSFARRRASSAHTKDIALDANGNRQSVSSNGVAAIYTMDNGTPEPADFQMDQYTGTPFGTEQHDRNGNLISRDGSAGSTHFTYDYADRLVLVERTVGPALVPVASFTYDALGRRISKTTFPPAPALAVTTQFILDPETSEIIEERENGVTRLFAVWPHMHQVAGHARISATGEILWVYADDLGSALALSDGAGNVLERYDYDEYGWPRFLTPDGVPMVNSDGTPTTSSPAGNDQLFRGMLWDGETGLYLQGSKLTKADAGLWSNDPYVEDACRWATDPYAEDSARYMDPKTGRATKRAARTGRNPQTGKSAFTFAGDNPWSCDVQEGKKGLNAVNVKLARMSGGGHGGGGGGGCGGIAIDESGVHVADVMFNPKEYSILKKEEGGRHTPFHNKYRPQFSAAARPPRCFGAGQPHPQSCNRTVGEVCEDGNDSGFYYEQSVMTAREASSGMATGRKSISVIFHNDAGEEAGRHSFFEAWPCRWKAPELNAQKSDRVPNQTFVLLRNPAVH